MANQMTISAVIAKIKVSKPNPFPDDLLTAYIDNLEQQVQAEVLKTPVADRVSYVWETDGDTVLLIPAPYDSCYLFYVAARIDFDNKEFESYNQNMMQFNSLYEDYKKAYISENPTASPRIQNIW